MKKVLLMAALFLGTTAMVNAQEPAKTAPAKEVKTTVKKHKKMKTSKDGDMKKAESTTTKVDTKTAAKK